MKILNHRSAQYAFLSLVIFWGTMLVLNHAVSSAEMELKPSPLPYSLPTNNQLQQSTTLCLNGIVEIGGVSYPCQHIDLYAFLPLDAIGGEVSITDIWGWADPASGKEYILAGIENATSFIDISDPANPIYLGLMPTRISDLSFRDIKVYKDHAFVVGDREGIGMQVFDLTQLRDVTTPPVVFTDTVHYTEFGNAHNLIINEESGFAYAVGSVSCDGGLHMINIQTPTAPSFAGCFDADGYTHDAQCVIYSGADSHYQGREICFNSNEDTLTIVNVTDKNKPTQVARVSYNGVGYVHQGWLTADQSYFLSGDESDEMSYGHPTRTRIFDVRNLETPIMIGFYDGETTATDHNLYIARNHVYEANYTAGLRVISAFDVANEPLNEVAYFDTFPENDDPTWSGAWTNYPFFDSGVVAVSSTRAGLFILHPHLATLINETAPELPAFPQQTVTHLITLENFGATDGFALSLEGNAWETVLGVDDVITINAGISQTIPITVTIPPNATTQDQFFLKATSITNQTYQLVITGTTIALEIPPVYLPLLVTNND